MFLVGLTGGIASGKSTVAEMFAEHGLNIVDADIMAKKVVQPGRKAWKRLKKEFGEDIMQEDGTLNREKLAEIIFNDRIRRKRLNEITHPAIIWEMVRAAVGLGITGTKLAVMDIPLLYESGELVRFMHKIIVVRCTKEQQIERLLQRTKMSESQAEVRVIAQMPLDKKAEMADYVIDNSGSVEETRIQVDRIVADLGRSWFHWKVRLYLCIVFAFFGTILFLLLRYLLL